MATQSWRIVRTPFPVYIRTKREALEWLARFYETAEEEGIGFDTETTGLRIIKDRIRFFSIAQANYRICAPVRLLPVFQDLLEDPDVEKRMTNAKYDMHMAANHGIIIRGHIQDSTDQDFLYDENRQGRHGLKATALDHLGLRMTPFKKVFGDVGKVENEVLTLCEVHDVLELHDRDGKVAEARERALKILIRLKKVSASEDVMRAFKRIDLSMKGGFTLDARSILKIARDYGYAGKTAGKGGYISDFVQFLGGPGLASQEDRQAWAKVLEDADEIEEAHHLLWSLMLEHIDASGDPVERLRTMIMDYASLDAWASYMLVGYLRELLELEDMITEAVAEGTEEPLTLLDHSEEVRVPFIRTLWNMERRGFVIDVEQCTEYSMDMQDELDRIERDIVRVTRDPLFNPNSATQLRDALFTQNLSGHWVDPFGDPPKKMTDGGTTGVKLPSTSAEVLEVFAGKGHELSKYILQHRQYAKLKGTYMDGLPEWVDRLDRIHTSLKSHGARTWRLASADPNLQNIPARDPVWGPRIRKLFVPGLWGDCDPMWCMEHLYDSPYPDLPADFPMTLIVADYKQLEMRIMAHFSGDDGMIEAISQGLDLHCQTVVLASERGVPGIPKGLDYATVKAAKSADKPTPEQALLAQKRGELKSTGFGIIYGIGAMKLGMQLGLPIVKKRHRNGQTRDWCPAAQELIDNYLNEIYPGVGFWIEDTREMCREELAVYTVLGHPRRLPDIVSRDRGLAAQAERQSGNSRIQGSAADITNEAMLRCEGDEELRALGVRMLLQVHDELVFEVPNHPRYIEPAKRRIKELMENPFPMRVPIEIDMDVADSWGDAKG
jgi:DNA polymerase I-like protein with 3'-5' exonuclease and polymerase domains